MSALLERRLIFVTGKGGVGKSTVAIALGLAAARAGRRTLVAELAGQDQAQRAFGGGGEGFAELAIAENLSTISIDPESAMEEYLRLKTGPFGQVLGASRVFQAFAMATPGMRELLTMGKVWELAQPARRTRDADSYDTVIVDAPAAGHAVGILRTPRTFAEIARVGPIAALADRIAQTIADPAFTAICAVALAEEMPVNETRWLAETLAADGLPLQTIYVNALYPERFSATDARRLRRARSDASGPVAAALAAALAAERRARAQREQLVRLRESVATELVELPHLFADPLGPAELAALAEALLPAPAAATGSAASAAR